MFRTQPGLGNGLRFTHNTVSAFRRPMQLQIDAARIQ